jgi:hypothetical protein
VIRLNATNEISCPLELASALDHRRLADGRPRSSSVVIGANPHLVDPQDLSALLPTPLQLLNSSRDSMNVDSIGSRLQDEEVCRRGDRHARRGMGGWGAVILLSSAMAIVGCAGGSTAHARLHYVMPVGRPALPSGAYLLAKAPWNKGGGRFLIVAESHRHRGKNEPEISTYEEDQGARGIFPSSGGLLGVSNEGAALVMDVERSCKGSEEKALAYGVLRDRRDTVSAREPSRRIVFRKVAIPAHFHVRGVLVYAQVGRARPVSLLSDRMGES